MKKSEIGACLAALKEIKMPKIEDKALRNALINDHFAIYDAGKKYDASIERLREVHLGAFKKEQEEVAGLQQKLQTSTSASESREILDKIKSYKDYTDAVKAFNEAVDKLNKEEVKGLNPIDRNQFIEEIQKQDTYGTAMFEGLFPLFNIEDEPSEKKGGKK